ncbi:restriction endonuclease subunit S [Corynebacterium hindlerae]|uniref:restriction endonuclease subunit S n=1 Tax=Corynebacterium hindlerae TaxID=699041 RepID=UPI001AD79B71|nr:restriction endonuclease subunit S [Corynebacterium hindlerae]QTH59918.1 restriction endonuclease subunit S [Corynebacterium hindlerae]
MNVSRETWTMVRLGDVCEVRGKTVSNFTDLRSIPYVGLEHLNQGGGFLQVSQVDSEDPKSAKSQFESGDILFGRLRPNLRKVARASFAGICSTDIVVLVPSEQVEAEYLKSYLLTETCLAQVLQRVNGINLPRISTKDLLQVVIPFPPLAEQRRIAEILETSSHQIQQTRNQIQQLEAILDSLFLTTISESESSTVLLGDVCDLFAGSSLPKGQPFEDQEAGILLMKVSDMNSPGNETWIHETKEILVPAPAKRTNSMAPSGSIVLPKRGAAIHTNKKRILTRETMLDPNLMAVKSSSGSLSNNYLYHWFRHYNLSEIASGSSVPQLNKKDLSPLVLTLPPMQTQFAFDEATKGIECHKRLLQRKLRLFEELHQSLSARAFAGQL